MQKYAKVRESVLIANNRHFDSTLIAFFLTVLRGGGVKVSPSTACCCQKEYTEIQERHLNIIRSLFISARNSPPGTSESPMGSMG